MTKVFDLSGRTALVTGGAGLLGVQHAHALAEIGATVYLGDIDLDAAARQAERLGARVKAVYLDVTRPESVRAALDAIVATEGGVQVLVNNAAIDPKVQKDAVVETSRLENFSLDQWDFQLAVGLTGAFLCSQVFGSWMAAHGGGVILNIASDLAVFAPDQRLYRRPGLPEDRQPVKPVTYSVIKHGLVGLTRYLATYWPGVVRANAISPGGVENNQGEEFIGRLAQLIPMGRMARADEYRAAIQFLCSDASSYMTGQNLVVDGGRSVW